MMFLLNRLRGTHGYFAKVTGIALGGLLYYFDVDMYTAFSVTILYIVGESFGWGKWFGGMYRKNVLPTEQELADREGINNGIHFLANLVTPEKVNYYRYCITALTLRGIYWFGLTLAPLVIMGYTELTTYIVSVIALGIGFPMSVLLGIKTETKYRFNYFKGFWEQSEVYYGVMQDIILISVLLQLV